MSENIMRRLRLNREAGRPESAFSVVLKASLEVRSAIVYATLIVALVFLPIFFLDGCRGRSSARWRSLTCWRFWPRSASR